MKGNGHCPSSQLLWPFQERENHLVYHVGVVWFHCNYLDLKLCRMIGRDNVINFGAGAGYQTLTIHGVLDEFSSSKWNDFFNSLLSFKGLWPIESTCLSVMLPNSLLICK